MDNPFFRIIMIRLAIIFLIVCTVALIFMDESNAAVMELDEASALYTKYLHPNHNPYFPQEAKDGLSITIKNTLFTYGFFNANVHGTSDDSQYRLIGLQYDLGVKPSKYFDIYYEHHSQHILDHGNYYGDHFPVEDSLNLKLYFYRR